MFSPDLIRNTINRQSSSSSSSNLRASPPLVPVVHVSVATAEEGQQPASSLQFTPIEGVVETARRSSTPISGRETPSSCNDGKPEDKPFDGKPAAKVVGKGREKGSSAYSVDEHIAVLSLMLSEPDAFNASESSTEWRNLYQELCQNYYIPGGHGGRLSSALHGHIVELYGAFKKGVRNLSLIPGSPKCPTSYFEATDSEISDYVDSLFSLIVSDKKKYMPRNWWSTDVVSMLLALHHKYTSQFGVAEQSLEWLDGKSANTKTKFEKDQKNREAELKLKRQREEEEQLEAAKNRKLVAESSVKLTATLDKFSDTFSSRSNHDIDDKFSSFKEDILQRMEAREKAAEERMSSKLDEKFGDLLRALRGG